MLSRIRPALGGAILGLLLSVVAFAAYALTFPELTGRVVDDAGILDPATKAGLEPSWRNSRPRPPANRRRTATRLARTDLHPDPGFVGIVGFVLVRRLPGGRWLLRRRRLVRRWRRLGKLVTS